MLTIQNKQLNSTFERIIRDKNGVLVRVRFNVVLVNGKPQAQIISVEPFVQAKETVIYLPVLKEKKTAIIEKAPTFFSIISPYFSLEFFMSQPTRAPSFL